MRPRKVGYSQAEQSQNRLVRSALTSTSVLAVACNLQLVVLLTCRAESPEEAAVPGFCFFEFALHVFIAHIRVLGYGNRT
jgi:hypothetical protein